MKPISMSVRLDPKLWKTAKVKMVQEEDENNKISFQSLFEKAVKDFIDDKNTEAN